MKLLLVIRFKIRINSCLLSPKRLHSAVFMRTESLDLIVRGETMVM
jgi:hypothetical protein